VAHRHSNPTHLIQRTLSAHKGARRLWLEGKRLADIGFSDGVRYERTVSSDAIVLRLTPQGDRRVSHKAGRPVVDTLTRNLGDVSRIQVAFYPGQVYVSVHPTDLAIRDRLRRLNRKEQHVVDHDKPQQWHPGHQPWHRLAPEGRDAQPGWYG